MNAEQMDALLRELLKWLRDRRPYQAPEVIESDRQFYIAQLEKVLE